MHMTICNTHSETLLPEDGDAVAAVQTKNGPAALVVSGDGVLLASAPADDESVVVKVRWRLR